uniref:Uncharacterized protein n=1 Tax=Chromera velia CCMP2878 TaxID=1169474 RepID=A0A0G4IDZ4_9ALVE|eukprot:Cvel_2350.t1-p1 / transcript=Cvel_2350.t1 / gene=Cvel_2350 / organism=Chromera_velia_CCMP2878 / gene_product=hypothetical protein / transcript_product=hypothetical protein / location=Cvel_scaffold91:31995-43361(-) / protein_length=145 / sequence_SO=supercontig / SO=protein_coding / is_pseudo=false
MWSKENIRKGNRFVGKPPQQPPTLPKLPPTHPDCSEQQKNSERPHPQSLSNSVLGVGGVRSLHTGCAVAGSRKGGSLTNVANAFGGEKTAIQTSGMTTRRLLCGRAQPFSAAAVAIQSTPTVALEEGKERNKAEEGEAEGVEKEE